MSYGRVIDGGAQMRKGVTKGINEKIEERAEARNRSKVIANAVNNAFKQKNLSEPTTNNVKNGSFQKVSKPAKV